MIIDWQYDPIKDNLLHVDLKRIDLAKRIMVKVPVVTHGDPKGVKLQGGLLELYSRNRNRVPAERHSGAVHISM